METQSSLCHSSPSGWLYPLYPSSRSSGIRTYRRSTDPLLTAPPVRSDRLRREATRLMALHCTFLAIIRGPRSSEVATDRCSSGKCLPPCRILPAPAPQRTQDIGNHLQARRTEAPLPTDSMDIGPEGKLRVLPLWKGPQWNDGATGIGSCS